MAFIEGADFCGLQEYFSGFDLRVLESDITKDELYTLMLRLDAHDKAARWPIRMIDVREQNAGFIAIRYALLDDDLNPRTERIQAVSNGILQGEQGSLDFKDPNTQVAYEVTQAYLKDYFDDQFGDCLLDARELTAIC